MPLRLLLVHDEGPGLRGLQEIVEQDGIEIVGQAATPACAAALACLHRPDAVVLDLRLPAFRSIEALFDLRVAYPSMRIVALAAGASESQVRSAFHAGIRGYVLASAAAADLARAVREVARGGVFLSPRASRAVVETYL